MTIQNIGIKGYDGLPFVDEEARNMLSQLGITNEFNGKNGRYSVIVYHNLKVQIVYQNIMIM
ncbi:MAG: hypothetical protein ACLRPW_06370 [Intestinibacter sp.]